MQPAHLEDLAAAIRACRACQTAGYLQRANPIPPAILSQPRIVLIGQAPGEITDRKGYHFAGPAGTVLEQWFERAGFPAGYFRQHVHLTSLTHCFPGKAPGGQGDRPPSAAEIRLCRPFLERELDLLQPKLIILLGQLAITTFLGRQGTHGDPGVAMGTRQPLSATIGQVYQHDGRTLLPLPHASGVSRWLNAPAHRALLEQALQHLARLRFELGLADVRP